MLGFQQLADRIDNIGKEFEDNINQMAYTNQYQNEESQDS